MNVKQPDSIPIVGIDLCMALKGKRWKIGKTEIRFGVTEKKGNLNVQPFQSGTEAYAYRVTDQVTGTPAFLKLYTTALTNKRLRRIEWLISQELWRWDESFRGSPRNWISTQLFGKPDGINSDFGGVWSSAVPGSDWHAWRTQLEKGEIQWSDSLRTSLARQLIRSLAILERVGMTHGDISDKNILIHVEKDAAKLYIIDFDGFVLKPTMKTPLLRRWVIRAIRTALNLPTFFSEDIPTLDSQYCRLTAAEGGTIGTRNYAPPELMKAYDQKQLHDLAPISDCHARDILLVELLCCGRGLPANESPLEWGSDALQAAAGLLQSSTTSLPHLIRANALDLAPKIRPSSLELADQLAIDLPRIQALREARPCIRSGFSQIPLTSADAKQPHRAAWSFASILIFIFLVYHFYPELIPTKPSPPPAFPNNAKAKIAPLKMTESSPAYERQEQLLLLQLQRRELGSRADGLATTLNALDQRLQAWSLRMQTLTQNAVGRSLKPSAKEFRFLLSCVPTTKAKLHQLQDSVTNFRATFIQAETPFTNLRTFDDESANIETELRSAAAKVESLESAVDELLAKGRPSSDGQTLAETLANLDVEDADRVNRAVQRKQDELQSRLSEESKMTSDQLQKTRDGLTKAESDLKRAEAESEKRLSEAQAKREKQLAELAQQRLERKKRMEVELPPFRSQLAPFISSGYRQLDSHYTFKVVIDAQPISYSGLLRVGALEDGVEGLEMLAITTYSNPNSSKNDRPTGSFPKLVNWEIDSRKPEIVRQVKEVQAFLRRHGEAMVDANLLAP